MFLKDVAPVTVDLNADLGEGGLQDEAVMRHVTSASIACGGHAGDPATMRESLRLCAVYGIAAGAHPSLPDRVNFGRRPLNLPAEELTASVREQLEHLKAVAQEVGGHLSHVKLHGLLYSLAVGDPAVARAVMQAIVAAGFERVYVTGSIRCALRREARALGLKVVLEGFADRGYAADGTLLPYDHPAAFLPVERALEQGVALGTKGLIRAATGETVRVQAQSIGLQGNGEGAAVLARDLSAALRQAGLRVRAPQ